MFVYMYICMCVCLHLCMSCLNQHLEEVNSMCSSVIKFIELFAICNNFLLWFDSLWLYSFSYALWCRYSKIKKSNLKKYEKFIFPALTTFYFFSFYCYCHFIVIVILSLFSFLFFFMSISCSLSFSCQVTKQITRQTFNESLNNE